MSFRRTTLTEIDLNLPKVRSREHAIRATGGLMALALSILVFVVGCGAPPDAGANATEIPAREVTPSPSAIPTEADEPSQLFVADVISVEVTGDAGDYRFAVEISSPDTGCDRYADWWEVLREDGSLVYRRILLHSHIEEQPFVRSGGPVTVDPATVIWIRAHMYPTGYGGAVLKGTVADGFAAADVDAGFAVGVEDSAPQPNSCAF